MNGDLLAYVKWTLIISHMHFAVECVEGMCLFFSVMLAKGVGLTGLRPRAFHMDNPQEAQGLLHMAKLSCLQGEQIH